MKEKQSFIIQELWGSFFKDDLVFESKDRKGAIEKYLAHRGYDNIEVMHDSKHNHIMDSQQVICVQKGRFEGNTQYISGRRSFYKLVNKS